MPFEKVSKVFPFEVGAGNPIFAFHDFINRTVKPEIVETVFHENKASRVDTRFDAVEFLERLSVTVQLISGDRFSPLVKIEDNAHQEAMQANSSMAEAEFPNPITKDRSSMNPSY